MTKHARREPVRPVSYRIPQQLEERIAQIAKARGDSINTTAVKLLWDSVLRAPEAKRLTPA